MYNAYLILDDLGKCGGVLGVSDQKTKYQPVADTMRVSQFLRNLRYVNCITAIVELSIC